MANQPNKNFRKDDTVQVIAGKFKGQSGKVLAVSLKSGTVTVEGLGVVTRHIKPSQFNPRGGSKEVHTGLDVSKVKKIEAGKTENAKPGKTAVNKTAATKKESK